MSSRMGRKRCTMGVVDRLKKYILTDGFHVVADIKKSHDSWIVDAETGKEYLDCYSQFASQALGWNHPYMDMFKERIESVALQKMANSDMYSEEYAQFVESFAKITPDFKHYFFIDGGALGVENALKAAFDWNSGTQIMHFKEAFHGRTGYTLSLTNNGGKYGNIKTDGFPQFDWPRITNPKIQPNQNVILSEAKAISEIMSHFQTNMNFQKKRNNIAASIIEPIQGEGGDNHFRKEFLQSLRAIADEYECMLIFDEVQTGVGLTGKMWCYEHFGVIPDLMCFGKKTQVCGFCSTGRIDKVANWPEVTSQSNNVFNTSGRINSTWGGNLVDMIRARVIFQAIEDLHLLERVNQTGDYFLNQLKTLKSDKVSNIRGRGLMLAFDMPSTQTRDELVNKLHDNMLVLKSGTQSIRFRPTLTFSKNDVDHAIKFLNEALS